MAREMGRRGRKRRSEGEPQSEGAKRRRGKEAGAAPPSTGSEDVARALSARSAADAAWRRHALLQLFPSITTLLDFLASLGQPHLTVARVVQPGDTEEYGRLLRSTLVAPFSAFSGEPVGGRPGSPLPPALLHERLSAVLLHASTRSMSRLPSRPFAPTFAASRRIPQSVCLPLPLSPTLSALPSVLSLGYRRVRQGSESALIDHPTVEAFEINSAVTLIQQSREWLLLLERVGEDALTHLLVHCFCFVPLEHACFLQVAGPLLVDVYRAARVQRGHPPQRIAALQKGPPEASAPRLKRAHSDLSDTKSATGSPLKRTKTDPPSSSLAPIADAPVVPQAAVRVAQTTAASPSPSSTPVLPRCILAQVIPRSSVFFHHPHRMHFGLPTHRQSAVGPTACIPHCSPLYSHVSFPVCGADPLNVLNASKRSANRLLALAFKLSPSSAQKPRTGSASSASPNPGLSTAQRPPSFTFPVPSHPAIPPPTRISPHLRSLLPLFRRLLRNHRHLHYTALFRARFPWDLSSSHLRTLPVADLLGMACPHAGVAAFVRGVMARLVPRGVWGSEANMRSVLDGVERLVWRRRGEVMTVRELMWKVKTSDMAWLQSAPPKGGRAKAIDRLQQLKRHSTASTLCAWLMSDVVVPLLRCCFHVTDSEAGRNSLSYYPHAVWQAISHHAMLALTTARSPSIAPQFTRIPPKRIPSLLIRRQGVGHLRLRPRRVSLRPIVNLTRPGYVQAGGERRAWPGVNAGLRGVFEVMGWERRRDEDMMGVSVFGLGDVYDRWRAFRGRLTKAGVREGTGSAMSVVCVDIAQCFDCIDRERLLRLLPRVLSEDSYALHRYSSLHAQLDAVHPRYGRLVYASSSFPSFHASALVLSARSKQRVFSDQVTRAFLSSQQVLDAVTGHVTDNVVQYRGEYYEQRRGIPQGSVLSSFLCCLYLGDVERRHVLPAIARYEEKRRRRRRTACESLLMRQMDDVLLVTTDRRLAAAFLPTFSAALTKVGLELNSGKTKTSFSLPHSSASSSSSSAPSSSSSHTSPWMAWNGLLVNASTLCLKPDYSRYLQSPSLASHFALPAASPGDALCRALIRFIQSRAHPLFLDERLNGVQGVGVNWVGLFVVGGMKGLAWAKEMTRVRGGWVNEAVLWRGLQRSVEYGWSCARSRLNKAYDGEEAHDNHREEDGEGPEPPSALRPALCARCVRMRCSFHRRFPFTGEQARWIAYRAYADVFARKGTRHPQALRALRERIQQANTHDAERRKARVRETPRTHHSPTSSSTASASAACQCCARWALCVREYDGWLEEHRSLIRGCQY